MFSRLFRTRSSDAKRPSVPEGCRIYAVGDVHGRLDLLEHLYQLIGSDLSQSPAREPVLVHLGDYIDRGPASAGVLERLAAGPPHGMQRVLLKGNHEEMLERFLAQPEVGPSWRQLGGMETILSYRVPVTKALQQGGHAELGRMLLEALPPQHVELIAGMGLSWSIGDYYFCHAGVRPGVPLDRQVAADLLWIREDFLDHQGDFGKVVVHGHTPVEKPERLANRINIDTGAYATNRLTCLVLEADSQSFLST